MPETFDNLQARLAAFRDERDWSQFHQPKDLVLALQIEAGELAELLLWKDPDQVAALAADADAKTALADEIADVMIYALFLADRFGLDAGEAIEAKMAKNAAKYPVAKAKGNATKYSEFGE